MIFKLNKRIFLCLAGLFSICGYSLAETPKASTPPPYIALSNNLDEPNGFGFCLDTYGRGLTDILHTHSCKPVKEGHTWNEQDNDIRYSFNPKSGQISAYAYEKKCMQALIAADLSVLALLECSDHPRQRFSYDTKLQTFSLKEKPDMCLAVGPKTLPAPPFVRRTLLLVKCETIDASRKRWTLVTK